MFRFIFFHFEVAMWIITCCVGIAAIMLLILFDENQQQQQQLLQQQIPNRINPHSSSIISLLLYYSVNGTTSFYYYKLVWSFLIVNITVGFIIPLWKYYLQQYKVQFRGPWDIPTKATMQLDYNPPPPL